MIFTTQETLEDRIIRLVLEEKASIKALHQRLAGEEKLSLRAVYKAVDKLIGAGVLIKAGQRVVLSAEWAGRVVEGLQTSPLSVLGEGERAVYTFASMEHLDAFWKTVVLPLEAAAEEKEIFFYNPHDFWAYLPERRESEDAYYRHFAATGRHGFLVVGGESLADREFKRTYQNENFQIDTRNVSSLARRDHLTILGPLVITVRLPKKLAAHIDDLYASGKAMSALLPSVLEACRAPGTLRFVLENHPAKAKRIKQLLAKNFYFKQHEGML